MKSTLRQVPSGVWVLGLVSLFMDMSSELIHGLLPMFMVTELGASMFQVGVIEGVAEATALVVKVFSGALIAYVGRRKGSPSSATAWRRSPSRFSRCRPASVWS